LVGLILLGVAYYGAPLVIGTFSILLQQQPSLTELLYGSTDIFLFFFSIYLIFAFFAVFFNVALAACANVSVCQRDSTLSDGITAAAKGTSSILVWTLFSSTIGQLIWVLDQLRQTSWFIRLGTKGAWPMANFFVTPAMAIEGRSILTAVPRSATVLRETWGTYAAPRFRLGWILAMMNIPLYAFITWEFFRPEHNWLFEIELAVLYFLFTLIIYQSAVSVLRVCLFRYAVNGEVPAGLEAEQLKGAFTYDPDY